jgi:hypothetical protein
VVLISHLSASEMARYLSQHARRVQSGIVSGLACRPSTSLQRLIRLDRVNRRDGFSMKKPLRSSARGASFHTKHASNVNAIETY